MNNNFKQTAEIKVDDLKAGPHQCKIIEPNHNSTNLNTIFYSKYDDHYDITNICSYLYKNYNQNNAILSMVTIKKYDELSDLLIDECTFCNCIIRSINFGDEVYTSDPTVEFNILWNFEFYLKKSTAIVDK